MKRIGRSSESYSLSNGQLMNTFLLNPGEVQAAFAISICGDCPAADTGLFHLSVGAVIHWFGLRCQANSVHSFVRLRDQPLLTRPTPTQPLFEHHQTKQKLVVVLATRLVTFEQSSDGSRIEQAKHE